MSPEPLDDIYLKWLYEQIAPNSSKSYWKILRILYTKEFIWIVPNDDNRAADGRDLRREFEESQGIRASQDWMDLGCSMLEMLIGLSHRLSFETGMESRRWFWELLSHLKLDRYSDGRRVPLGVVDEILDTVIWRTYDPNGIGGLFPLEHPEKDQRLVEIWYQLSSYLLEKDCT